MRLFVALDLDNEDYFKAVQAQIPEAKKTNPKAFHLTLKFLGETDKQDEIIKALNKIKFKPLTLNTTSIGAFPSENYINVVWLGLEDNKDLAKLQKDIDKALESFNFVKDYSEFKPHITLARIKFILPEQKPDFVKGLKQIKFEKKEFKISEFKLISSELTKAGPVYTEVESFE